MTLQHHFTKSQLTDITQIPSKFLRENLHGLPGRVKLSDRAGKV